MAGAMHKMAVYLGLVEEDRRYDDGYDSYEEEYTEYEEQPEEACPARPPGRRTCWQATWVPQQPASSRDDGASHRPHSYHDPAPAHIQ